MTVAAVFALSPLMITCTGTRWPVSSFRSKPAE